MAGLCVRYHGGACEVGVPMAFLSLANSFSSLFCRHFHISCFNVEYIG